MRGSYDKQLLYSQPALFILQKCMAMKNDFTQGDERNNKPLHCQGKNKSLAVNVLA